MRTYHPGTPKAQANPDIPATSAKESSATENANPRKSAPTKPLSLARRLLDPPVFMGLVQALEGHATSKKKSASASNQQLNCHGCASHSKAVHMYPN